MHKKCVEGYCELANKNIKQLYTVSTSCLDDHQLKPEELETVGELSKICSHIVLKCLFLARIGSPDSKPIWRNSVTFRKSILCSSQLDAQEGDCSLTPSTESEVLSSDTGLRMDGIPSSDLSDMVIKVLHSPPPPSSSISTGSSLRCVHSVRDITKSGQSRNIPCRKRFL